MKRDKTLETTMEPWRRADNVWDQQNDGWNVNKRWKIRWNRDDVRRCVKPTKGRMKLDKKLKTTMELWRCAYNVWKQNNDGWNLTKRWKLRWNRDDVRTTFKTKTWRLKRDKTVETTMEPWNCLMQKNVVNNMWHNNWQLERSTSKNSMANVRRTLKTKEILVETWQNVGIYDGTVTTSVQRLKPNKWRMKLNKTLGTTMELSRRASTFKADKMMDETWQDVGNYDRTMTTCVQRLKPKKGRMKRDTTLETTMEPWLRAYNH